MQGGVLSKVPNCYFFFSLMVLLFCGILVENADKKVTNILQGNFSHGLVSSFETQCNARVFRCLLTKVLMCKVSKSNFVNITDAMNKVHVQNNFTLYAQYAERTLNKIFKKHEQDLHRLREHALGIQNKFYLKSQIEGFRIQRLGSLTSLAWIGQIQLSCLAGRFYGFQSRISIRIYSEPLVNTLSPQLQRSR